MFYENIILVDFLSKENNNLIGKKYRYIIDVHNLEKELETLSVNYIFHFGANSDTSELDYNIHETYNTNYSKMLWKYCTEKQIPLIYASSAATYGDGKYGYNDEHSVVKNLLPLNPYGLSKNNFDKWCLEQTICPPFWYGLKFFNVYGPNEYHKNDMASIIFKNFNNIKKNNSAVLYKSHNIEFKDGEQMRDFVYVKDLNKIIYWLIINKPTNGIYNTGSGEARTFKDLVKILFETLCIKEKIDFIDTPEKLIKNYQYFTEANMNKLYNAGYKEKLYSLEDGIKDYVNNYLNFHKYF